DGIRDYKVTGVQTCALPIWHDIETTSSYKLAECRFGSTKSVRREALAVKSNSFLLDNRPSASVQCYARKKADQERQVKQNEKHRSEERRVGKECRKVWWKEE